MHRFFQLKEKGTTWQTEIVAGLTTFLTMAYALVVNPAVLSTTGMSQSAIFVATCLAAAIGCFAMGLLANYPVGLAPSMGLNAYFAYTVVQKLGYSWQIGLGAVFCSGIAFTALTLLGIRQRIIYILPNSLKFGIAAGIGLFLGVIGLQNVGLLKVVPHFAFYFSVFTKLSFWLAVLGLGLIFVLERFRVYGAILIGIVAITITGIVIGITPFKGIFSWPPSIQPTLFALQLPHFNDAKLLMVIFTFFFVALFDSTGTLIAILQQAKLIQRDGRIPRLTQALFSDSFATTCGSLLGTSTTGSYIESSAGVKAGGKTGLTAVIVGLLFLAALFFAPLAETVPVYATAPALVFVAILMARSLVLIKQEEITDKIAAVITAITIPITFSIAHGISLGIISYVLLKIFTGNIRQVNIILGVLSVILAVYLLHDFL